MRPNTLKTFRRCTKTDDPLRCVPWSWDIVHNYRRNRKGVWQRHVVDTIPALIHTTYPDGHLDYFNPG